MYRYLIVVILFCSCSSTIKIVNEKETLTSEYIEKSDSDFKIMESEDEAFIMFYSFNINHSFSITSNDVVYRKGKMDIDYGYGDRLYVNRNSDVEIKINNSILTVPIKKLKKYRYIYIELADEVKKDKYSVTFTSKGRKYRM